MRATRGYSRPGFAGLGTFVAWMALAGLAWTAVGAPGERRVLQGHRPALAASIQPLRRIDPARPLRLAIGLPLRQPAELQRFLADLYDPKSPLFRQYVTPAEFTERFGPTEADYQAAEEFAVAHGLRVTSRYPNRMVLDVMGAAADVERAFQIQLHEFPHPTEARTFFAPDGEPSVPAAVPILDVGGLNSLERPRPAGLHPSSGLGQAKGALTGSGPNQDYTSNDIRQAYAKGVTESGVGQSLGLLEFDGFYTNDIAQYRKLAGVRNVPIKTISIDGFDGIPSSGTNSGNAEVSLDIEMAMAMAPGLTQILVYEASPGGQPNSILSRMVSDNIAAQISSSWTFGTTPDATSDQLFQQMQAQGQSFFNASGDSDAILGAAQVPTDSPYVISVGGTSLTTTGPGGSYVSETVWNRGGGIGSTGGFSARYAIPSWQKPVRMLANLGSTTHRNYPDVAFLAENVLAVGDQGNAAPVGGTSVAAPLWAGVTALINQRAAAAHQPRVGFLNPALYALGLGANYGLEFHDITNGNNINTVTGTGNKYPAVAGYDLATGWGTPQVQALITNLYLTDPLGLTPNGGVSAYGAVGGPFNPGSATYAVTNSTSGDLAWDVGNVPAWLTVSPTSGTNRPGDPRTTVTLTFNASANALGAGPYSAAVHWTNRTTGTVQTRVVSLHAGQSLVQNGGFENGDFSYWTLSGPQADNFNFVDANNDPTRLVTAHSGKYAAALGQNLSLTGGTGTLAQVLPTVAGQSYVLSYWFESTPDTNNATIPNQFRASWDGQPLSFNLALAGFSPTNLPVTSWELQQYRVTASSTGTTLAFAYYDDPGAFGLDDVSVLPIPAPTLESVSRVNNLFAFSWSSLSGVSYQVESAPSPGGPWTSLGGPTTASSAVSTATDPIGAGTDRFYRVRVLP